MGRAWAGLLAFQKALGGVEVVRIVRRRFAVVPRIADQCTARGPSRKIKASDRPWQTDEAETRARASWSEALGNDRTHSELASCLRRGLGSAPARSTA